MVVRVKQTSRALTLVHLSHLGKDFMDAQIWGHPPQAKKSQEECGPSCEEPSGGVPTLEEKPAPSVPEEAPCPTPPILSLKVHSTTSWGLEPPPCYREPPHEALHVFPANVNPGGNRPVV